MCGKRSLSSSVVSDSDDVVNSNNNINDNPSSATMAPSPSPSKTAAVIQNGEGKAKREGETLEEKRKRRKLEKKQRKLNKLKANGKLQLPLVSGNKKVFKRFNDVWDRESEFVSQVMQCLPEVRQPGSLLEEDEWAEEHLTHNDDAQDETNAKNKFFAKVRKNLAQEGVQVSTERAKTYQELRERLHRKIAELSQTPNEERREKKQKKKLKKAQERKEKSNKGKKLISQSAATAGASNNEDTTANANSQSERTEKTPLKKKPVVKSNGEIVYSKFDFISKHKGDNNTTSLSSLQGPKKNPKPKPDELLKKAEKHEKKVSNLAAHGKQSEAVSLVETQKWETALKRADGEKVRDDAYLLKKTVKKQEKMKQLSKKKWKERMERVEKQKELRQQKRQTNIQSKKDDKKKKTKKLLRKRGRIA